MLQTHCLQETTKVLEIKIWMEWLSGMKKITNKPIVLGCVYDNPNNNAKAGRGAVYDINGISPTILTMSGGE